MRRFSIRSWLFVLALAVQAAAATVGFGLDERLSAGEIAYCQSSDSSDRQAPSGHGRHGADCVSCQICHDGWSPLPAQAASDPWAVPSDARATFAPPPRVEARSSIARSHRARAPPLLS